MNSTKSEATGNKEQVYNIEGKDYKRIITNANLTNGSMIKSYIYIINNKLLYYKTTAKRWRKIYFQLFI